MRRKPGGYHPEDRHIDGDHPEECRLAGSFLGMLHLPTCHPYQFESLNDYRRLED